MRIPTQCFLTAAVLAAFDSGAMAFPIAAAGTEGHTVVVAATGHVVATYLGSSASYFNDLMLNGERVFNNHVSPAGTKVELGVVMAGTELVFELHVHNTGHHYFTGPAGRNPDAGIHARVQANLAPDTMLVSFEDLFNGPFDYNDLSFSLQVVPSAVPEPGRWVLALAGLACLLLTHKVRPATPGRLRAA